MSISNFCFLTYIQISQEAGQVVWYSHLFKNFPQFAVIHTAKDFNVVNKAEVDVFLEFSCFFYDPMNVGNLTSGFSHFFESSFKIWKFSVHILLMPGFEDFACYFASVWDKYNFVVVWTFFGIAFLWDWNENWPFPVLCSLLVFQICWHIKCGTLTASSFRIWNSSAGIPLSPLALFLVILPKTHWTSNSKMSTWVIAPSCLYGSLRSFSYSSSVYSCYLFSTSSAYVRSTLFLSFIVPIFAWNFSFISLIFLKKLLIFPILLFPSISLHWSLSKTFLSFLFSFAFHFPSFHNYS